MCYRRCDNDGGIPRHDIGGRSAIRYYVADANGRDRWNAPVPSMPQPKAVVLIIAGSGPTDRDGNSTALPGKNDAYKLLAAALAGKGVASVR